MTRSRFFVLFVCLALSGLTSCSSRQIQAELVAGAGVGGSELLEPAAYGISLLSAANAREKPGHKAELGTQILMGHSFDLLSRTGSWYQIRSADGYRAWLPEGNFVRCTAAQLTDWTNSPRLLVVTVLEDVIREQPKADALPICDVVIANCVRQVGPRADGEWLRVELPDLRAGYLRKACVAPLNDWLHSRKPAPETIEATARQFLGRPYLWGGNSPKGLDCSGFTKLVYHLNGVDLLRNASQQATQGVSVALDPEFRQLRTGDLLFFGHPDRGGGGQRVTHVGIYLGGPSKNFIHSFDRVKINSLDANSPNSDTHHTGRLLFARRVLP